MVMPYHDRHRDERCGPRSRTKDRDSPSKKSSRSPLVLTDKTRDRCFLERTEKDDYHDEETISISEKKKGKR